MAPTAPSNENASNSEKLFDFVDSEKPLTEEDFLFHFHLSQHQSPNKRKVSSEDENVGQYIEVETTEKNYDEFQWSSLQDREHDIFMYNFLTRNGSQKSANIYLQNIENTKKEEIRAELSKLLKLNLDQASLSAEETDSKHSQREKLTIKEKSEQVVAEGNEVQLIKNTASEEQD